MKKWIAPLMLLLPPAAVLLASAMGYEWVLVSERGTAAVFALLFCAVVLCDPKDVPAAPVAVWSVPLAVVNLYLWLFAAQDAIVFLLSLLCAAVSLRLLKCSGAGKRQKIASAVLALLLFVPYLLLLPVAAFGFAVGETELVDTVVSPDGSYRAELLNVDQGALGGDTVVDVYNEGKMLHLGFAQLREKPRRVYMGPWGAFEEMELTWKSDDVLCINGVEYEIKGDLYGATG